MTPNELFDEFKAEFKTRKFVAGLLIAFIDFFKALGIPGSGKSNLDDVTTSSKKSTLRYTVRMLESLLK